jgi:hypothetical protein
MRVEYPLQLVYLPDILRQQRPAFLFVGRIFRAPGAGIRVLEVAVKRHEPGTVRGFEHDHFLCWAAVLQSYHKSATGS